jgi:hypothetical protein
VGAEGPRRYVGADSTRAVGTPVAARTTPAPELDDAARAAFVASVQRLAPQYRPELLGP